MKWIFWALGLGVAGVLAWPLREAGVVQRATDLLQEAASLRQPAMAPVGAASGLRKCLVDGKPLYTNDDCPAGSRAQWLEAGSLSVLPAAPASHSPAVDADAPIGPVRPLLGKPLEKDLKEQRMDAVIRR